MNHKTQRRVFILLAALFVLGLGTLPPVKMRSHVAATRIHAENRPPSVVYSASASANAQMLWQKPKPEPAK